MFQIRFFDFEVVDYKSLSDISNISICTELNRESCCFRLADLNI
jgi:hypothetical protein